MTKRKWTAHARMLGVALAAVGAIVWTGCDGSGASGSGSSYCDSTGCYTCDGYSCAPIQPPTPTACTGTNNCPSGYTCTTSGCEQSCTSSAQCAQGTVCTGGYCVPPGSPPGTPKICTTNADCPLGDACVANACVATDAGTPPSGDAGSDAGHDAGPTCGGTLGPCPCTANTECAANQVCVAGVCTAASNACQYSSQCAAGDVCANGQCVPACSTVQCATGFTCVKGACEPNPTGTPCTSNAQCPTNTPICVAGTCSPACTADTQCPKGDYCNQGACVPDTRPTPNCKQTSDCIIPVVPDGGTPPPQACVGGFCLYTCSDSQHCATIDVRIDVCSAQGVCVSPTEANPACKQKSDCPSGQDCIGNVCK